jgi:hypothetical protein
MIKRFGVSAAVMAIMQSGCGKAAMLFEGGGASEIAAEGVSVMRVEEELPPPPPNKILNATPQIAYSYSLGYRLPATAIGTVQQAHVQLCDQMGAARCRIVTMQSNASSGEYGHASLELMVEAKSARDFGVKLDKASNDSGGETISRSITAEDLGKRMNDTNARIKAKQALADRLLHLIQTQNGEVSELVEAENAFSDAQEELDAARSWMAEMQQRVALSEVTINYQSESMVSGGMKTPVRDALTSAGKTFGESLGALIGFVVLIAPWAAVLALLVWIKRKRGWRLGLRDGLSRRWARLRGRSQADDA